MRWPRLPAWTWEATPGPRAWMVAVAVVVLQAAVAAWGLTVLR